MHRPAVMYILWLFLATIPVCSQEPVPIERPVERISITITRAQHVRLPVRAPIARIAIGDGDILGAEALNNREILLLGKTSGRTTLLVWFFDGSVEEYIVTVHRDLSLLQSALRRIHPSIEAEIAPDRDAIVLTGVVPDVTYQRAADEAARAYLQANPTSRVLIRADQPPQGGPSPAPPGAGPQPPGAASGAPPPELRVPLTPPPPGAVINLIRLENLPPLPEQKITEAIRQIGGASVNVRRIIRGPIRDDSQDLFVLEGRVPDQVALTRILTLAANVVTGQAADAQDIRVVADEGGGLANGVNAVGAGGGGVGGGFGGALGSQFGGAAGASLNNQVRRNIARAKVLQAAGGRVLSFVDVADVPQVRVGIRLYEINRAKLKSYTPNFVAQAGQRLPVGAGALGQALTGTNLPLRAGNGLQQFLGFINGTLSAETQLTLGRFAMDAVFSYLEQMSIARNLSSPSLTVLSGEQAQFAVGGDIPVPETFSPAFGTGTPAGTTPGVFSSVAFLSFGISLSVRPLVGEDDTVTVDVLPLISTPDATLTASIRENTGTNPLTTAFQTRSLRTSARLQDGQVLVIGGLFSHNTEDTQAGTPGLRDVPGFGWLFKNLNRTDDSQELIIVVNPAIVRDPIPGVSTWEFPGTEDVLSSFVKGSSKQPPEANPVVAKKPDAQ